LSQVGIVYAFALARHAGEQIRAPKTIRLLEMQRLAASFVRAAQRLPCEAVPGDPVPWRSDRRQYRKPECRAWKVFS